jgi:tetratricopeptide (TPR) repeat protein
MGKASRKKKLIQEGFADKGRTFKSSKEVKTQREGISQPAAKKLVYLISIISIVIAIAFAVYSNALSNGFVYDDGYQILQNPWITDAKYIPEIFSKNVWGFRQNDSITNYYRPMMHLIYMFNYHIFGLKPWGFHLVNIFLHAGCSVLVFLIVLRLLRISPSSASVSSMAPPFIAALLFATHPIHTEAVTWVAGLTDVSCTFFYLLSFYFYIRSTGSILLMKGTYLLSIASFFLAALCKEIALTLPLILVVYDYASRRDEAAFSSFLKKYIPYLVVAGFYFILRFHALGQFAPKERHAELTAYQYFINIFPLITQYLEKLILPVRLNAFYVLHPISSLLEARGVVSLIITIVFVGLSIIAFRRNKVVFFGMIFIVVPLLPALYIPGLGENTFTERYLYLPSFGFVLLFASLIEWVRVKRLAAVTSLTVVLVITAGLYSWATVNRNAVWRDDYTLYTDTVGKSPDAKEPRNDFGVALLDRGKIDEAIEQLQIASKLNPYFIEAHYNLGIALSKKGRIDEAIEQYQAALKLNPKNASAHNNLGLTFFDKGLLDKAAEQFEIALQLNPYFADAHNNLGLTFLNEGRIDKAIEQYEIAIRLNPNLAEARHNLGLAFFNKGLIDKAAEQFQNALKLDENSAVAHNGLGMVFFRSGRFEEAAQQFQIALKLDPNLADAHNNMGVIYKKSGDIDKAIAEYQAAVRLNPSHVDYRANLNRAYQIRKLKP